MSNVGEFELLSGRRVKLHALKQYRTYEGWLEGYPTTETNNKQIEQLLAEHRQKPYVIRPTERPIDLPAEVTSRYGVPAELPSVTCIGRFGSDQLGGRHREEHDCSELVIIWFQDDFAFPIDPEVLSQLVSIDWDAHAAATFYI